MSMHKKPLTELERAGLEAHGLDVGTPSQLSDAFRQGVAWAQVELMRLANEVRPDLPDPIETVEDAIRGIQKLYVANTLNEKTVKRRGERIAELEVAARLAHSGMTMRRGMDKKTLSLSVSFMEVCDAEDAGLAALERVLDGATPAPAVSVPAFSAVAARKLSELQVQGFTVSGYSIERTESAEQVTRGFIDHGGLVGWWHPENAEPAAPAWKPEFDAMSPRQEQLVVQFCAEIAGPKGRAGSAPDPVRLLEMAQALYEAERENAAINAAQQTR